jgi:hypothetical protein
MLENFCDFYIPLMNILDSLPLRTGQSSKVLEIIEARYGDQIAPSQLENNQRGNIKWIYNVRMCKEYLKQKGYIDSPNIGIWRLSEYGHDWLKENPSATHLYGQNLYNGHSGVSNFARNRTTRRNCTKVELYNAHSKHMILEREIGIIKSFLEGHSSYQPTDEKICDWIYLCYTFEMYGEGRDLFCLIDLTDINPWYYERTKKIAKACEQKVKSSQMKLM